MYDLTDASTSLASVSSELESLRSAYQDLETKLAEADKKRERAEKQLSEKNSELLQKESSFVQKRQVDSDTIQKLQKEVNGLRNYMTTTEKGWDLLNSEVMGKNPDSEESNESANLYLFFDSTFFCAEPLGSVSYTHLRAHET